MHTQTTAASSGQLAAKINCNHRLQASCHFKTQMRKNYTHLPESSQTINVKEVHRFTVHLEVILKFKTHQC